MGIYTSNTDDDGDDSLSQKAFKLLDPVRQQYNLNRSLFSTEEQMALIEEFLLILQEVKYRVKILHSPQVRLRPFLTKLLTLWPEPEFPHCIWFYEGLAPM